MAKKKATAEKKGKGARDVADGNAEEKQKKQAKGNGKAKAKPAEAETVDESDDEST
jgi:hypothetical protein